MSDVNPIEVHDLDSPRSRTHRALFDRYQRGASEIFVEPGEPRREREGLPRGYRMRADAHYVDELLAADPQRPVENGAPPDRTASAEPVASAWERSEPAPRATVVAALPLVELAEQLAQVEAATALLASAPSPMARGVAVDLIRSGSWRAAWLLQGQAMLGDAARGEIQVRRLAVVFGTIVERFAPESRLSGVTLQAVVPDWNLLVNVDEPVLIAGLTGAVMATLGLVANPVGSVITLMPGPIEGSTISLDVAQDAAPMPADMAGWFFDLTRRDRPGGAVAAIGAALARAAAERHGGDASVFQNEGGGTTVRLRIGQPR